MTTTERVGRLEVAQEVLGFLMAVRSAPIDNEGNKARSDATKIAQWEAERNERFDLEDGLRPDDPAGTERIITTYGLQARQAFMAHAQDIHQTRQKKRLDWYTSLVIFQRGILHGQRSVNEVPD